MPKIVIALVVWFMWSAGKDLDALVRYSITSDYYILSNAGLMQLYFVMGGAVFLANLSVVYLLFRPGAGSLRTVFIALGLAAVQGIVTFALAIRDLPGAREAYARGREIRGLSVREDALDMIFTPGGMLMTVGIMLILYALVASMAWRSRRYLSGVTEVASF